MNLSLVWQTSGKSTFREVSHVPGLVYSRLALPLDSFIDYLAKGKTAEEFFRELS